MNAPANITLESFSRLRAPIQGRDIHRLVTAEQAWLNALFPGTVRRYGKYPNAVKNVSRLASRDLLQPFIVRKEKVAVGLATIIFDQNIEHPTKGPRWGSDLDYWLRRGSTPSDHTATADALVYNCLTILNNVRTNSDPSQGQTDPLSYQMFATMKPRHWASPVGLAEYLQPVGEPAALTTFSGSDQYGVTKDGTELQLYHGYIPMTPAPRF